MGDNISDVWLAARESNKKLFTIRTNNWNEKLARMPAADIFVQAPSKPGTLGAELETKTLQHVLENLDRYGGYAGVERAELNSRKAETVNVRYQTTFVPVDASTNARDVVPRVYNYQTKTNKDPKNLLLLASPQGLFFDANRIRDCSDEDISVFLQELGGDGGVDLKYIEVKQTDVSVSTKDHGADVAREAAARLRGDAAAARIGPKSCGQKFNVLLMVQIPLKQKPRYSEEDLEPNGFSSDGDGESSEPDGAPNPNGLRSSEPSRSSSSEEKPGFSSEDEDLDGCSFANSGPLYGSSAGSRGPSAAPRTGRANAARAQISKSSALHRIFENLPTQLERDWSQEVTVTVTFYHAVSGGVVPEEDVKAAVDELIELYSDR